LTSNLPVPEISIRKMETKDIDRVSEIDQNSFSLPWPKSSFSFEIERNEASRAWVAETIETGNPPSIVGMLVTWMIVDELHIATLATDLAFRQQNIALKLMVNALCSAVSEGAQVSFLEVRRSNLAAQSLYQKLGYRQDGVRPHYYQDNHEDAILMSLRNIDPHVLEMLI